MQLKKLAAAAALVALTSGSALAADPPSLYMPEGDGSIWDGFYAGVLGGIWDGNSTYFYGGGLVGVNHTFDNFLIGVEGRGVVYSDGDFGGDVAGRLGFVFDNFLVFGDAGVGVRDGFTHTFAGGGIEAALQDNLSVGGTVEFVTGSGFNAIRSDVSLKFHF
jgi:hypothetical protein